MQKHGLEYLQSTDKRNFDKVGGLAVAAALAPLAIGVGIASAIDMGTVNPLFLQERACGQLDNFQIYKFRTIRQAIGSQSINRTYGTFDPRTSHLGQLIRQTGLDEVPQVINVLKGEMSLVGPRPLIKEDIEKYEEADSHLFNDWYSQYVQVRPGITGKSQIMRHHYKGVNDDMRKTCMRMDIDYFKSASRSQDMQLILATPLRLLMANVAVEEVSTTIAQGAAQKD